MAADQLSTFGPAVQALATFVSGVIAGIIVEPLRTLIFRPRLKISFNSLYACNMKMTDGRTILRLRISNKSRRPALKCKAYISRITMPHGGNHLSLSLDEARPLHWAFGASEADLYRGADQYVDLAGVGENKKLAFTAVLPARIATAHQEADRFVCRVTVVSEYGGLAHSEFQLVRISPMSDFAFADVERTK